MVCPFTAVLAKKHVKTMNESSPSHKPLARPRPREIGGVESGVGRESGVEVALGRTHGGFANQEGEAMSMSALKRRRPNVEEKVWASSNTRSSERGGGRFLC